MSWSRPYSPLMDIMAVRQGVFTFTSPDFLGLPIWEFFMWGFYVFHCLRLLGGPAPRTSRNRGCSAHGAVRDPVRYFSPIPWLLLAASGTVLAIAVAFFHERWRLGLSWLYDHSGCSG